MSRLAMPLRWQKSSATMSCWKNHRARSSARPLLLLNAYAGEVVHAVNTTTRQSSVQQRSRLEDPDCNCV